MPKFLDNAGGSWVIEISHADYVRLKRDTALDLDQLGGDSGKLDSLLNGPSSAIVPVMEVLLGAQVKASGLSVEDFHARFTPSVVARAGDALFEAIFDFFHPRQSGMLPNLLASLTAAQSTNSVGNSPESVA